MTDYYVYALLDPTREGRFQYDNLEFNHEPFYIGYGRKKRYSEHYRRSNWEGNFSKNRMKNSTIGKLCGKGFTPCYVLLHKGLTINAARYLEMIEISKIGRLDKGQGPLTNKSRGGEISINNGMGVARYGTDLKLITTYKSLSEANFMLGTVIQSKSLTNPNSIRIGSFWRYVTDFNNVPETINDVTVDVSHLDRRIKQGHTTRRSRDLDRTICAYDINGDFIESITDLKSLAEKYGVKSRHMTHKKLLLYKKKYHFLYAYTLPMDRTINIFKQGFVYEDNSQSLNKVSKRPVYRLDENRNLVQKYDSVCDAGKVYDKPGIYQSLRTGIKHRSGYWVRSVTSICLNLSIWFHVSMNIASALSQSQ